MAELENAMRYGISAGVIILNDQNQILLVHHPDQFLHVKFNIESFQ